jgi:hypothetical protein
MPKITPRNQKEAWYEKFEQGHSIARLARDHKKDPRTIQRAIEEIRLGRQTAEAKIELLKDGLRRHQEELLGVLGQASNAIQPLPTQIDLHYPGVPPPPVLALEGAEVHLSGGRYTEVILDVEKGFPWGLLREHLGNDRAILRLGNWRRAVLSGLNATLALRGALVIRVGEDFGLTANEDISREGAIRPAALGAVLKDVVAKVLGAAEEGIDFKPLQGTEFSINGRPAGRLPREQKGLLEALRDLPSRLVDEEPALQFREAHERVATAANLARDACLEAGAAYYLPGTCRVCKRFGI